MTAKIEPNIAPPFLYRYRGLENFEREITGIENATLYCAPYIKLNDPMEGFYTSSKRLAESANYRELRGVIANLKADVGICSFCESRANELMWAHYADEFKGICIQYSFPGLLSQLEDGISFTRLNYSENAPVISNKGDKQETAKRILSFKNFRWQYEREWRMFGPRETVRYIKPNIVKRVYLGSRITQDNQRKIIDRLAPLNVEIHKMSLDKYSIGFERCT